MNKAIHFLLCLSVMGCAARQVQQEKIVSSYFSVPSPTPSPTIEKPLTPLEITLQDAVMMALENNPEFRVKRFQPAIRKMQEQQQEAGFDPLLKAQASTDGNNGERLARAGSGTETFFSDNQRGEVSTEWNLPTGTRLEATGSVGRTHSSLYQNPFLNTRFGLTVTQSLLQGFGTQVNLAALEQARLDTHISQYELRGFAEALIARVEQAYWDYALAQQQIKVLAGSLALTESQLKDVDTMIEAGKRAGAERIASHSEVAMRRQEHLNAERLLEQRRLQLLQLLQIPQTGGWEQAIVLLDAIVVPEIVLENVDTHVQLALQMRADMHQAQLGIEKGELALIQTRNGLLPKLDVFLTLGKTGYAESFAGAIQNLAGPSFDFSGGLNLAYPLFNRDSEMRHQQAQYSRQQLEAALANMAHLVQVDIRTTYVEVLRLREQITAVRETLALQEKKMQVEMDRFRIGKTSSFQVAQAQRDLLNSQLSEIQAIVNYRKALVDFFRLEGTLLERHGILAPGK